MLYMNDKLQEISNSIDELLYEYIKEIKNQQIKEKDDRDLKAIMILKIINPESSYIKTIF